LWWFVLRDSGDSGGAGDPTSSAPPGTVALGQPAVVNDTTYIVYSATATSDLSSLGYSSPPTNGTFIIIDMSVQCTASCLGEWFLGDEVELKTTGGSTYEYNDDVTWDLTDGFFMPDLDAGQAERGLLAFDIPTSEVSGLVLEVTDLHYLGSGTVILGL